MPLPALYAATVGAAGELGPVLHASLSSVWNQFLAPSNGTLHWVYLLVAFSICYGLYRWERRCNAVMSSSLQSTGARRLPPSSFYRFLFPGGFLGNRGVRLDLFFFLTTMAIGTIGAFYLIYWSFDGMRTAIVSALGWVFPRPDLQPSLALRVVLSLLIVLTVDLQLYSVHWLLHNTKVGWAIHQTHHSQRELNVFTDDREHPIYPLVQHLVPALVAVPIGAAEFVAPGIFPIEMSHVGIGFVVYRVTKIFRHSHVLVRFPRWVEWLFQSPAFHLVHHSCRPEHLGKNIGNITTVWDRLFGTLYVPKADEHYQFGTGDPEIDAQHTKLRNIYIGQTKRIFVALVDSVRRPIAITIVTARTRLAPTKYLASRK